MLTTASLKLTDLLSGPFLLNVPVYQRPYSWGPEQVQQLVDDLTEAAGLGSSAESDETYFLGTILLMDMPGNKTDRITLKMATREFDVVDGQQRLVTFLTMFCVLRDLDESPKRIVAKRVQSMVNAQMGKPFFRTERTRMQLSSRDRAVFEQYVLQPAGTITTRPEKPPLTPSEAALLAMRNLLVSELGAMAPESRDRLFDFIDECCRIVLIVSHDIDNAHRTFVVLNERGKQLQRDDILKADILSRVSGADMQSIASSWDETGAQLGKDFEVFFSHIRKLYGFDNRQVVSGVRSVVAMVGGAEAFIDTVFVPYARTYQTIKSCDAPGLPVEIVRRLKYLSRLADGDWAPAALLALKDWQADPERATFLIAEIDRMAHVLRLLCAGAGKRNRRFSDVVDAIRTGGGLSEQDEAFQLSREEVRSVLFHLKDLHKRGPKICKLVLMRLGDASGGGNFVNADPEIYTIEHVLPQRPSATSDWRKVFPNAEERSQCVESLGNLVLITQEQNDKARNASFDAKKLIYAAASERAPLLPITADILSEQSWRREEIEAREQRLISMIVNLWRIEPSTSRPVSRSLAGPSPDNLPQATVAARRRDA